MTYTFRSATTFPSTFSSAKLYTRSANRAVDSTITLTCTGKDGATNRYLAVTSTGGVEQLTAQNFTELTRVVVTGSAGSTVELLTEGTPATANVTFLSNPTDGQAWSVGLGNFQKTYTFATTPASDYDVAIAATATLTAANLMVAMNASGVGDGSDYYGALDPHPHLEVLSATTGVLAVRDRIGCERLLPWCFTGNAPIVALAPSGGSDGLLVATILPGDSMGSSPGVVLSDEGLALGGIAASSTWTSAGLRVYGKPFSIHLRASNVTTPMAAHYEYSNQVTPTTWLPGLSTISALDDNLQVVSPAENVEHVRLVIVNTNTSAASVDARVVRS